MNVDLEAVCKIYLLFKDSEFVDRLDEEAERKEKEQKERSLIICKNLPEEEAEYHAKTYRIGIMEGYLTVASELRRLISIETGKEFWEFEKDLGYICPNCGRGSMISKSDYIPVLNATYVRSYDCQMCGFSREFPKAILVRDIFTEYANREREKNETS